ncbi:MAG: lipase [Actinomycetales bacterium]|nr:MAG: lipase [Actinomycetales bacterium]
MLDDLAPQRRRTLLAGSALLVAVVLVAVGIGVVRTLDPTDPASQDELGPVLLVSGYGGRVASLDPLRDALRSAGRDVEVLEPEGDGRGDLRAQAAALGRSVDAALERTGADSVDVVGYSAGGVVARLWVRDQGGADVARRVLTIGSPHHGTDVAALAVEIAGSCPTACEQLVPDSDLLRGLNAGDETPDGPEWVALRSDADRVVVPTDSAMLDGALNLRVQRLCPGSTTPHRALPGDAAVLATVASALGRDAARTPTDVSC